MRLFRALVITTSIMKGFELMLSSLMYFVPPFVCNKCFSLILDYFPYILYHLYFAINVFVPFFDYLMPVYLPYMLYLLYFAVNAFFMLVYMHLCVCLCMRVRAPEMFVL